MSTSQDTLPQAAQKEYGITVNTSLPRFNKSGWSLQGTCDVNCEKCATLLTVFRRPYTTSQGSYRYWAIVCRNCATVRTLEDLTVDAQKALKRWDRSAQNASTSLPSVGSVGTPTNPSPNITAMRTSIRETDEQRAVIDAFCEGHDLRIQALAGTGKTTTLSLAARASIPRRCQYIAFNRAIVEDARSRFSDNVNCQTAHSLAFREVGKNFAARLSSPRVRFDELANHFACRSIQFSGPGTTHALEARDIARYAKLTVDRFVKSLSVEIDHTHVPRVDVLWGDSRVRAEFTQMVVPIARAMWDDVLQTNGYMKFEHDHYLKMWQMGDPSINADAIMFDEAQDADPVMLDVINKQSCQVVYCGDTYQSVYEWRGAQNALDIVNVDLELWLTQSFRFGAEVAVFANDILRRIESSAARLIGNPSITSVLTTITRPDAIMCRTNAGVVFAASQALAEGRKPGLLGPVKKALLDFGEACRALHAGRRTGHPELAPFSDWSEVVRWTQENPDDQSELSMLVRLINAFEIGNFIRIINSTVDEAICDVLISTVHRTKGREWKRVKIGGDFQHPADMDDSDLRVLYVAVTRARNELDISNLPDEKGLKPKWTMNSSGFKTKKPENTRSRPPLGSKPPSAPRASRPPITPAPSTPQIPKRRGLLGRLLGGD
jgi:hypothetical protein